MSILYIVVRNAKFPGPQGFSTFGGEVSGRSHLCHLSHDDKAPSVVNPPTTPLPSREVPRFGVVAGFKRGARLGGVEAPNAVIQEICLKGV